MADSDIISLIEAFQDKAIAKPEACDIIDDFSQRLARNEQLRRDLPVLAPSLWSNLADNWKFLKDDSIELSSYSNSILSLARFTRNLVAGVPVNQENAFELEPDIRSVIFRLTSFVEINKKESHPITRMIIQTLSNVVTGNMELCRRLWSTYITISEEQEILVRLLDSPDIKTVNVTLILIFNSLSSTSEITARNILRIFIKILDRTEDINSKENESREDEETFLLSYRIFENIFDGASANRLFMSLSVKGEPITPHQTTFLKLLDSYLRDIKSIRNRPSSCNYAFLTDTLLYLSSYTQQAIKQFSTSEQQGLDVRLPKVSAAVILLAQCVNTVCVPFQDVPDANLSETGFQSAVIGSRSPGFIESLIETLRQLDRFLPRIVFGKAVPSNTDAATNLIDTKGFAYLKRDLVRLVGTICYQRSDMQDRVRECEGIPVIMGLCVIDERNPYLQEHALFALRNILHQNPFNQAIVHEYKLDYEIRHLTLDLICLFPPTMFFSTELLARRDSGYGLLWLAATLGSKSKKLARREVVSADITRLCALVSQPPEPLALRLSSNLMVGVARVYRIKYDIFENDVSNCVMSLRKSLNELRAVDKGGIEMLQVVPRPDTLNLQIDPAMSLAIELDGILDHGNFQDEVLVDNFSTPSLNANVSDKSSDKKQLHKLDESFEHFFSSSLLQSLGEENFENPSLASANVNDVFFNLDFDEPMGLGEEMEKDLEQAWNLPLRRESGIHSRNKSVSGEWRSTSVNLNGIPAIVDQFDPIDGGQGYINPDFEPMDMVPLIDDPFQSGVSPMRTMLANKMEQLFVDISPVEIAESPVIKNGQKRKMKKSNIIIDPTTELPGEQMKANGYNYYEEMKRQKLDMEKKRELKEKKRRFEEAIWNPPSYFSAPELVGLWHDRVLNPIQQQEALWRQELEDCRPKKRRQIRREKLDELHADDVPVDNVETIPVDNFDDMQMEIDTALPLDVLLSSGSKGSSQDPEQLRHASRAPSLRGSLLGPGVLEISQGDFLSNNIFPWDNARISSPNGIVVHGSGSVNKSEVIEGSVVRLRRGSSRSGSLGSSPMTVHNDVLFSDVRSGSESAIRGNDEQITGETQEESDNIVTLERNSFNFLGYVKMHETTSSEKIFFSDIVPIESSSARVAAEALATKNFISLTQIDPYGPIRIQIL
ncbi:hypothetical protein Clacol_005451 [Clathrus columnatus]|uniref:Ataxin-10 homolog n=1 Tax=Clathrus columnatus TaxID=1419009 RepID=A0AAV5A9E9_9AGAM|nr:hypothetical protein Clacol_005451 [Clathrus columnatus]